MATAQDYINHPDVLQALQTVKGECRGKEYSDIIDSGDHQYVDLVMEGGGVILVVDPHFRAAIQHAHHHLRAAALAAEHEAHLLGVTPAEADVAQVLALPLDEARRRRTPGPELIERRRHGDG